MFVRVNYKIHYEKVFFIYMGFVALLVSCSDTEDRLGIVEMLKKKMFKSWNRLHFLLIRLKRIEYYLINLKIMKKIVKITYVLAFVAFLLSAKYLYNSYINTYVDSEIFLNNIILAFSNSILVVVFLYMGKNDIMYNSEIRKQQLKKDKFFNFLLLVYVVFCLCILFNFTSNFGFFTGESLFNQIVSFLLSVLLIGYFIFRLKLINKKLSSL